MKCFICGKPLTSQDKKYLEEYKLGGNLCKSCDMKHEMNKLVKKAEGEIVEYESHKTKNPFKKLLLKLVKVFVKNYKKDVDKEGGK